MPKIHTTASRLTRRNDHRLGIIRGSAYSRTRLTDAHHRRCSISPARPGGPGCDDDAIEGDQAKLVGRSVELGEAPGPAALEPTTATDVGNTRIGDFWQTSTWQTGQTITHHAGQTGGYASYLGLDRGGRKAVVVLSDVANDASDLGSQLLANRD